MQTDTTLSELLQLINCPHSYPQKQLQVATGVSLPLAQRILELATQNDGDNQEGFLLLAFLKMRAEVYIEIGDVRNEGDDRGIGEFVRQENCALFSKGGLDPTRGSKG